MPDKNEYEINTGGDSKDRVGDILRKERITRRITVETIAKDLKLNVKYIKALESSDFGSLPADPYVRVYLRSLAKYLSLDPEEILSTFYEEKGVNSEVYKKDTSNKLQISMQESETKQNPAFLLAIVLIILAGGFVLIANRMGWIPTPEDTATQTVQSEKETGDSSDGDSLHSTIPVLHTDHAEQTWADKDIMQIQLRAINDSVWVQVFSDGESWKNFIYHDQERLFTAKDSFNIHVGNNSLLEISVDGEPIKIRGTGVVTLKLDRAGFETWPLTKWNRVFRGRL